MHCAIADEAGLVRRLLAKLRGRVSRRIGAGLEGRLYTFQSKSPPLLVLLKNKDKDGRPF